MNKLFIISQFKDGQLQNRTGLTKLFRGLKDGKYEISVTHISKRSNQQNRYLHGLLIPEFRKALNSVGYNEVKTDEQAKLIMKSMFLTREMPNESGGKPVHYVQDTSPLSKEEMGVLIEEVISFAAENMNYQIAYPNEQITMYERTS